MNAETPEDQLGAGFISEMLQRTLDGDRVELGLSLDFAFSVLAGLQLALRHPGTTGLAAARMREIACYLEEQLGRTPAAKEVCRRGWLAEYDGVIEEPWMDLNGRLT